MKAYSRDCSIGSILRRVYSFTPQPFYLLRISLTNMRLDESSIACKQSWKRIEISKGLNPKTGKITVVFLYGNWS